MECWGISGTTWGQLIRSGPIIIVTLIIILVISKQLTILNLGESLAKGLGQNVSMIRGLSLVLSMILAGVAVAMVGQIAFVGLMVPSHCSLYYRYRLFKSAPTDCNIWWCISISC